MLIGTLSFRYVFLQGFVLILILIIQLSQFVSKASADDLAGRTKFAGIPAGVIRDVESDQQRVYVAAENGVFEIIGATSNKLDYNKPGIETGIISDIQLDGKYLWITEYAVGVFRLDLETRDVVKVFSEHKWSTSVWAIAVTHDYIALSVIDGVVVADKITHELPPINSDINHLTLQDVYSITTSDKNEFLIATRNSYLAISPSENQIEVKALAHDFSKLDYATFVNEIDGKIYLGGNSGFYIVEPDGRESRFISTPGEEPSNIEYIFKSADGNLWVSDGTLWQLKESSLVRPKFMNPTLSSEVVTTIVKIADGPDESLLISSSQLGLIAVSKSQKAVNLLSLNEAVLRNNIHDITLEEEGVLLTTNIGIFSLDETTGVIQLLDESSGLTVKCIRKQEKAFIYASNISAPKFCASQYRHVVTLNNDEFFIYFDDGESAYYYAIHDGAIVDRFKAPRFLIFSTLLSSGELAGYDAFDNVHFQLSKFSWRSISATEAKWQGLQCLLERSDVFLVCTSGAGLKSISKKTGELSSFPYVHQNNLRFIRGAVITQDGNLWITTNMGLFVQMRNGNALKRIAKTEGIFDVDFEYRGVFDVNGKLLILGDKYSYIIDEKKLLENLPSNYSTEVSAVISKISWNDESGSYEKYFPVETSLELPNSLDDISLSFVSESFLYHGTQSLEYRIDKNTGNWSGHDKAEMVISLSDLDAGDHLIQVRVKSPNAVGPIKSLTLTVQPPIWASTQALAVYAFCLLLCVVLWRFGYFTNLKGYLVSTSLYKQLTRYEITDGESKFEKMLKTKEEHISEITHELRTPIQIIQGTLENVSDSEKESDSVLKSVQSNMRRVEQLIEQMQSDSPQLSKVSNYYQSYDIESMRHIVMSLEPLAKAKRQSLDIRSRGDGSVSLVTDSLEKIIINLVENAIKYTDKLGVIKVTFLIENKSFKVTVSDNGVGVTKEQQASIFDRFVRFNNTESGEGLGLSIVKNLVELNQGEILLYSKQGGGTKVSVEFPIDDTEYINAQSSFQDSSAWRGTKQTLLIVDDSREFRTYLFNLLSPKYRCLVAKDGKQAFEVMKTHVVSLVICDQMMGKSDGLSLTKKIREHASLCTTLILMLTASSDASVEKRALEMKVDYFLIKPSSNREIELRVEHLLSLRGACLQTEDQSEANIFKYGCLNIPEFKTEKDMAFYLSFIAVLENNYKDEEFNRDQAAQALLISPRSLNRRMAELFDYNFSEFLSRYRIEKSIPILLGGSSILNACLDVGFATSAYFSTTFKKIMGVPPKMYVEQRSSITPQEKA
ncbi:ATP-binding protein [Alteromonas hispanica]|uniref:histidine kinase n=1 Tax=Alteromonas hispanica TaxID=315421 RepID=A0A6L9MUN2_9ALTE|nr:ATP-binding protein [Alteromonas hispanica]NDW21964.1 response regulator [Alteromonas hispanica]